MKRTSMMAMCSALWMAAALPAWSQASFKMYWNATNGFDVKQHPTKPDFANLMKLPDEFRTDVVVLYEHRLGIFDVKGPGPMLKPKKFQQHLEKVAKDLQEQVPDPDFSGLIVLDYEAWAPGYAINKKETKDKWKDDYLKHNPAAKGAPNLESLLEAEFDSLTTKYYRETVRLCKEIRPKAKFGMYSWPFNYMGPAYLQPGTNIPKQRNDTLYAWAWEELDVLTPCVYQAKHTVPDGSKIDDHHVYWTESTHRDYVKSTVREAKRLAKGKPVLPYIWAWEDNKLGTQLMTTGDTTRLIDQLKAEGADGFILWDNYSDQGQFNKAQAWIQETLLPELVKHGYCKGPKGGGDKGGDNNNGGGGNGNNGNGNGNGSSGGGGDDTSNGGGSNGGGNDNNGGAGGGGDKKTKKKPGMASYWLKGEKQNAKNVSKQKKRWLWVRPKSDD